MSVYSTHSTYHTFLTLSHSHFFNYKTMELRITDKSGATRLTASPDTSSTLTEEVGGECALSLSFTTYEFVELQAGDRAEVLGVSYSLLRPYRPVQKDTQTYQYSFKMYAPIHDAERAMMLNLTDGQDEPEFVLDGGPREHLQKWVDNMNRLAGSGLWSIGTVLSAPNKTIEYSDVTCWDAAFGSSGIAATFETEMWADGYVINLCKAERGERVELGYMQGLQTLEAQDADGVRFFTRLFPLGPTRNIDPEKYGHDRLQLPDRAKYVDLNTDRYGLYEATEEDAFSELYPQYTGAVTAVRTETKKNEQGKDYTIYYIKDGTLPFDPSEYEIAGEVMHVVFQSGDLNGRDFEANWHKDTREWEIINQYPSDGVQLPGGELVPRIGDKYIPWNFRMPDEYVTLAEQTFKKAVDDYLASYSIDTTQYGGHTDYIYVGQHDVPLRIGQNVRLLSGRYFAGGHRDTRMTKVVRRLQNLNDATITCSDKTGTGWKDSVDSSLLNIRYQIKKQGESAIDIIKTTDTKTPSDNNVYSALKALATFLRKDTDDEAAGTVTWHKVQRMMGGAVYGDFAGGFTGFGGRIDGEGNGELESLAVRRFLEVPELRFSRTTVTVGTKWRTVGAGLIESVTIDTDADGKQAATGTVKLKLQDGEIGAVAVHDICIGVFHSLNPSDNATENSDDSRGNFQAAGFYTCYFTITEVSGAHNDTFRYQLRPVSDGWKLQMHPSAAMSFAAYGNFDDKERQTSVYETTTYTRMLRDQNTWEMTAANIALQYGDLSNLSVHGYGDMTGYSLFAQNVYFTGTLQQLKPDGTPVRQQNFRGEWVTGTKYDYYDTVTHDGTLWLCVNEDGTTGEPAADNADWLHLTPLVSYSMDVQLDGQNTIDWGETVTATCTVWHGTERVDTSRGWTWAVTRDSGSQAEDTAWNQSAKATAFNGTIALSFSSEENDLGLPQTSPYGTKFTFTATEARTRMMVKGTLSA